MALLEKYVQVPGKISALFEKLRQGQAPSKFSREFLRDMGFKSSNDLAFIPLLKGLGFLDSDGSPTQKYKEFLDETKWDKVLADAIKEAYSDIFVIKSQPDRSDKDTIAGKYKSTYNLSNKSAERAASTFLSLLDLADKNQLYNQQEENVDMMNHVDRDFEENKEPQLIRAEVPANTHRDLGLHYNIQIHLPATKDIEIYNAIFKSLKVHLID